MCISLLCPFNFEDCKQYIKFYVDEIADIPLKVLVLCDCDSYGSNENNCEKQFIVNAMPIMENNKLSFEFSLYSKSHIVPHRMVLQTRYHPWIANPPMATKLANEDNPRLNSNFLIILSISSEYPFVMALCLSLNHCTNLI